MTHPFDDPRDIAYRPPFDPAAPFPPESEAGHPHLKELLYRQLPGDALVVDVGCGPGPFEYADYPPRFLAFDMFEPSTREGLKPGRDEFRLGRLEKFPLDDGQADAVVLGFILEHVEDPAAFLREADRVLRPGGWCYVAVPNYRSIEDRLFRLATRLFGSKRGPHIQRFTFQNFRALAEGETLLRLRAWHLLPASFLFLYPRRTRWARRPLIALLKALRILGYDPFREGNYQFLFQKTDAATE